jgi:hypothetical protein
MRRLVDDGTNIVVRIDSGARSMATHFELVAAPVNAANDPFPG